MGGADVRGGSVPRPPHNGRPIGGPGTGSPIWALPGPYICVPASGGAQHRGWISHPPATKGFRHHEQLLRAAAGWRKSVFPGSGRGGALTVGAIAFAPSAGAAGLSPLVKPAAGSSSSAYLGGYQATPSGGLASASTTFTMPKLTCTATQDNEGDAILFGVYTDNFDVYAFATGAVLHGGHVVHVRLLHARWRIHEPSAVAPGDVVVASLFESGSDAQGEIHDLTRGSHWLSATPGNLGDTVVDIGTYNDVPSGLPWRTSPRSRSRTPPSTVTTSGSTARPGSTP